MHESEKIGNVCLLAIVIVVVCRQPISAYADAKIFNKNTVFCSKLSLRGWQDSDFRDCLFRQIGNTALCMKKYHKNEQHLCLVTHSFTKLSQNMCLINMVYQYANCRTPLDLIFFFGIFIHNWHVWKIVSLPNFYRLCVWLIYTFLYVNMLNMTAGSWFNCVYGNFHILLHVGNVKTSSNFYIRL